jgi:deferrochelatase/peroxidase EfeB
MTDRRAATEGTPGRLSRRRFLGVGAAAGLGALAATSGLPGTTAKAAALPDGATTTTIEDAQLASFEGPHQAVVLSEPAQATTFAAFDVIAETRSELEDLLRTITLRMRRLYQGGLPANLGPASPPDDNGVLGPELPSAQVAFVLGLGSSLFDERYGLAHLRPAKLTRMLSFPNDNLDPAQCGGDLSIQICAGTPDVVLHALRDLTKHTRGAMQPRWRLDGFQSPPRPSGTPRNLLGFKDGIANPGTADSTVMDDLVWVGSDPAEPEWAVGGTYQVVRIIRMLVEFWDRVSLDEQETMIGRRRASGAPLDANDEFDIPDYAGDPHGTLIPLDAHIRLANPRTRATDRSRILRRGYNYDRGLDSNGNLDMGLLFTCYQRDLEKQFVATQTRLIDEPLVDYISPVGGGYFFCPPGLDGRSDYFGQSRF